MISFNKKNIFFTLIIISGSLVIAKCELQAETECATRAKEASTATEVSTDKQFPNICSNLVENKNIFTGKISGISFSDQTDTAVLRVVFKKPNLSNQNLKLNVVPFATANLNFSGSAKDRTVINPPFDVYYNNPNIYLSPVITQFPDTDKPVYLNYVQEETGDVSVSGKHFNNNYCQFIYSYVVYEIDNPNIMYIVLYYDQSGNTPATVEIRGTLFYEVIGKNIVAVECMKTPLDNLPPVNDAEYICCINC